MSTTERPFAFVLMPFAAEYKDAYEFGIKLACADQNVVAERVDEQRFTDTMLQRIYRQIDASDFIIAEMSGKNPNVFYEVGYAHAKDKLCILITKSAADIPFDLKHHRHIVYDGTASDLKAKLEPEIAWAKSEAALKKSESVAVSIRSSGGFLTKTDWSHSGEHDVTIEIKNNSSKASVPIDAIYLITSKRWTIRHNGTVCGYELTKAKLKRWLIRSGMHRLPPDGFTHEEVNLKTVLWWKSEGEEPKDEYKLQGYLTVEVAMGEKIQSNKVNLDVVFDEFPF